MSSDFDKGFKEKLAAAEAVRSAEAQRRKRIGEMCADGARKCSDRIKAVMKTDSRVAGGFTLDPTPTVDGNAFKLHFAGESMNMHFSGAVTHDGSGPNLGSATQDPSWTTFNIRASVYADQRRLGKRSQDHTIRADFGASGEPSMDIATNVVAARDDLARQ